MQESQDQSVFLTLGSESMLVYDVAITHINVGCRRKSVEKDIFTTRMRARMHKANDAGTVAFQPHRFFS
jgi:hypothetical protein